MTKFIPQKIKNIYHLFRSVFSAIFFGFPAKKIKVIGVTGTNGKTTTVQMIAKILEEAGHKVAVSSTINFKIGDREWVNKTKFTTMSGWHVQKFISQAVKENCEFLILEVASHALDQNRVWGMRFDVAVVTNVTREHLDYHKTMEEYRLAKTKLFKMLKKRGVAVVNLEMKKPEEFIKASAGEKLFGYCTSEKGDKTYKEKYEKMEIVEGKELFLGMKETDFIVEGKEFYIKLSGWFNVENALAAICVGLSQDINLETSRKALAKIEKIPGRMDRVENPNPDGAEIIIDYALTPDSMEKIGDLAKNSRRNLSNRKVFWVFGSCGDRDRGKRPIMGKIVAKYADFAIVTNEDPYTEDPEKIIEEVFVGLIEGGKVENENAWKVIDRKEAIRKAIKMARRDDLVLITGKGAEEMMQIGKRKIPWNDKKVTLEILENP